jgi:enoyl-CoA hydratase
MSVDPSAFANLLVERDDAVAIVTVNRPKVMNALNVQTLGELRRIMTALAEEDAIRSIVVTGAGEKAFVAGADISELAALTPAAARDHAAAGQQVFDLIEQLGKPVVAAINGFALGGGCELAMACTIRIAAATARLGQPEINLGLIPGFGGTQRLPRLVGAGRALELLLLGDPIAAEEAFRIGLVNKVVPAAELMDEARRMAKTLAGKAPIALGYILDAVHSGAQMPLAEAQAHEAALFGLAAATGDMREGTRAFLEKRKPEFKGH